MARILDNINTWAEFRRFLWVAGGITLIIGGAAWRFSVWNANRIVEKNTEEVNLNSTLEDHGLQLEQLNANFQAFRREFSAFRENEDKKIEILKEEVKGLERKIQANHDAFMFSIEHQGKITREAMKDAVLRISDEKKKQTAWRSPEGHNSCGNYTGTGIQKSNFNPLTLYSHGTKTN